LLLISTQPQRRADTANLLKGRVSLG